MSKQIEINANEIANQLLNIKGVANRKNILREIKKNVISSYSTNTARAYFTIYRNALLNVGINTKSLHDILTIHKAKLKAIQKAYKNKVELNTQENTTIKISKETAAQMIVYARELLQSDSYYKTCVGLLLLLGRRTSECLLTAKLEKIDKYTALFYGQLKKKGSDSKPYKIPLLAPFEEVNKALLFIQNSKTYENERDVNSKASTNLGRTVLQTFYRDFGTVEAPHDLRKLYAAICYSKQSKRVSFRTYAALILGHETDNNLNTLTTETYYKYQIIKN